MEGELGLTKAQVQTWFVNKRLTKGIKKASGGRDMPATLSVEQLDQLTTSFTVNSFPSKQDRQLLSTLVGMTEAKVNNCPTILLPASSLHRFAPHPTPRAYELSGRPIT